jgi:hypothetical protein
MIEDKSSLLRTLIEADLRAGNGVALVDPHGDLATEVLGTLSQERKAKLILIDPTTRLSRQFPDGHIHRLERPPVTAGGGKVDVVGGGSSVSASSRIFFKECLEKDVCPTARDHRAAVCDEVASAPGGASR